MILSILTLCCDKDWQCMSHLLNVIEEVYAKTNYSFDGYEIIIADNRDKYASEAVDWAEHSNVTVMPNDPKRMQYNTRREQTYMCHGDYIWFVDGDDLITCIPLVKEHTDIIGFDYYEGTTDQYTSVYALDTLYNNNDLVKTPGINIKKTVVSKNGFTEDADTYILGSVITLWPKIFKKQVVIDALDILPGGLDIIAGEDLLLWVACLTKAHSISYFNKVCYFYNRANSINHKPTFTFKQYSRMIKGVDMTFNILHDLRNRGLISCTNKWIDIAAKNNCYVFAGKLLLIDNEEDRLEAIKLLLSIFSSRSIETSVIRYYLSNGVSDRHTLIKTLLELDKLLSVGEPKDPALDYLIQELDYADRYKY